MSRETNDHLLYGHDYRDLEGQIDAKQAREIRHNFVRKVYGILAAQFALTTFIGGMFTLNESWNTWILGPGQWLIGLSLIAGLVLVCTMSCVPAATQKHPANLILLFGFTVCEALGIGAACAIVAAANGATVVLQAAILCTLVVSGLTFYAFQTKRDLTTWSSGLMFGLLGLMGFGMIRMLFPSSDILETLMALGGAVIFGLYLIIDTQRLIGEKVLKVAEDEYIMIALALYLDIINLFMYILRLLSRADEDN